MSENTDEMEQPRVFDLSVCSQQCAVLMLELSSQADENSYQRPGKRNFHGKIADELTGLAEVSTVCWQTETFNLPMLLSASASIQTGVILTDI